MVGEACDGDEVLKFVEQFQPDILRLDLLMPKVSWMDVLRSLAESHSKVRTILLSGAVEEDEISRTFELGARGLVLKDSATNMLFLKTYAP